MTKTSFVLLLLLGGSLAASAAQAQATRSKLPADWKPFVRLQSEQYVIETYQGAQVDASGNVVSKGTLAGRRLTTEIASQGSGTIVTPSGLILTNYHVVFSPQCEMQQQGRLVCAEPASTTMDVYVLADNDPRRAPVLRYKAQLVGYNADRDVAALQIVKDVQTGARPAGPFSYVKLGNPYDVAFNDEMTVIGYPGAAGSTVTVTYGPFNGYYQSSDGDRRHGTIKTVAVINHGNSGGASLYKGALVGLPTWGFENYAYLVPVTWAARAFVMAKVLMGTDVPELNMTWLQSEFNTDAARTRAYVAGRVEAAQAGSPVQDAYVVFHRADRTIEQIQSTLNEVQALTVVMQVKAYFQQGVSVEELATHLETDVETIQEVLRANVGDFSVDAQNYLEGEFFLQVAQTDASGYYVVDVPRNTSLRSVVTKDGFRDNSRTVQVRGGLYEDLGRTKLYQH